MSNTTKHTKGPWHLVTSSYSNPRIVAEYDYSIAIADMPFWKIEHWEERLANARLIAAAPELLEACKSVRKAYQDMFDVMPVAFQTYDDILEQAIAKASGVDRD